MMASTCKTCDGEVVTHETRSVVRCARCSSVFHMSCQGITQDIVPLVAKLISAKSSMKIICRECEKGLRDDARSIVTGKYTIAASYQKSLDEITSLKATVKKYEDIIKKYQQQPSTSSQSLEASINVKFQKMESTITSLTELVQNQTKLVTEFVNKPVSTSHDEYPPLLSNTKKLTFAEALRHKTNKQVATRNIRISADEPNQIMNKIKEDSQFHHIPIRRVKSVGQRNITVEFESETHAKSFDAAFNSAYTNNACSTKPINRSPTFKIIGIGHTSDDELINTLKQFNHELEHSELKVVRTYTVDERYRNAIIECDVNTLNLVHDRGTLLLNMTSHKCFEDVPVTQCYRCYRFGHLSVECKQAQICRICGEAHGHNECPNTNKPCCINCVRENKFTNANLPTGHRSTDDRCPMKKKRVEAIKQFLINK